MPPSKEGRKASTDGKNVTFSTKRYLSSKTKIFQESALKFSFFFRLSHPLSEHLEAKGLQIEFFKFYHVKEGTFSKKKKKINIFSWRSSHGRGAPSISVAPNFSVE